MSNTPKVCFSLNKRIFELCSVSKQVQPSADYIFLYSTDYIILIKFFLIMFIKNINLALLIITIIMGFWLKHIFSYKIDIVFNIVDAVFILDNSIN